MTAATRLSVLLHLLPNFVTRDLKIFATCRFMEDSHAFYEHLYKKEGQAPWTFKEPPKELVELVESGMLKPCKALDVGCGEGYISDYLASKGFEVTGIDLSSNAIELAKRHSKACRFIRMDWKYLSRLRKKFDFIIDWRFLQEILDITERKKYIAIAHKLLNKDGKYLSVAFSGQFKQVGNSRLRKSPVGIILYMPTNNDLEKLFGKCFEIIEKRMIKLPQRKVLGGVSSYFFFMKKR